MDYPTHIIHLVLAEEGKNGVLEFMQSQCRRSVFFWCAVSLTSSIIRKPASSQTELLLSSSTSFAQSAAIWVTCTLSHDWKAAQNKIVLTWIALDSWHCTMNSGIGHLCLENLYCGEWCQLHICDHYSRGILPTFLLWTWYACMGF